MEGLSGSRRVGRLRARNKIQVSAREAVALKAVGYLRVSTEEQAREGHGLEAQERAVRAFAESQGYELLELVTDAGVSGATRPADRAGFRRIVELAAAGAVAVILVKTFDRLARHIAFAVTTTAELGAAGVALRSVTEPIDTVSPAGRMMFAVLAAMAEAERDTITERTKSGRVQKALGGGFAGGRAPYGYERDGEGGLRIVEAEAAIVRLILAARRPVLAGARRRPRRTLQDVASELNRRRVPPPKGRRWHPSAVAYIADNAKYGGAVEYLFRAADGGETHVLREGAHAPIR